MPSFRDRWINQETSNSSEISFGFDFGAKDSGKLAAKILIGAGMANDNGTDDSRLPLFFLFLRFMSLMQFSL